MITIEHYPDFTLVYDDSRIAGIVADCYARGWDNPNYPMPALPGFADWYVTTIDGKVNTFCIDLVACNIPDMPRTVARWEINK